MSENESQAPGEVEVTEDATVSYDDETVVWEGRPSQWINFGTFLWWALFLIGTGGLLLLWNSSSMQHEYNAATGELVLWGSVILMSLSVLNILYAYLSVHYEHTVITRNKIKEAKGITSIFRQELFCEISDITDIKSPPAGLLGILGLSNLVIETNDDDQPTIRIRAIRNRDDLVNTLHPIWRKLKVERKGYFGDR